VRNRSLSTPRFSLFWIGLAAVAGLYLCFLIALLGTTATYTNPRVLRESLDSREIGYATTLSFVSSTTAALLALLVAVPIGYLLARARFTGKAMIDAILDIPIVLPPTVVGLCLLIFFQTPTGRAIERVVPFTYAVPGVILAQFLIASAFAIRTMRGTFDHLSSRPEDVAMTLGCSRGKAVWLVTLPAARRGMFAAFSLAWARSLGEFGPVLIFVGVTRMKTEVLPTSIYLELTSGHLDSAVAVSLLMVALALVVLVAVRLAGQKP
jgi:molybdate transport system permease protein